MLESTQALQYTKSIAIPGATFSEPDRKYRYTLTRVLTEREDTRPLCIIGLNPSTADERNDDPTIRREVGFANRGSYTSLRKANLFGLRSTDPLVLLSTTQLGRDPIGIANNAAILACARDATLVVAAWGTNANRILRELIETRALEVQSLLSDYGIRLFCFGTNKGGSPKHPLYLSAKTEIVPWTSQGLGV